MAARWVRARKPISRHAIEGGYKTYQPGDWFQCNRQEMRELVQRGMVDTTPVVLRAEYDFSKAGVLVRGDAPLPDGLDQYKLKSKASDRLELPWELTVLWKPDAYATPYSLALGLTRLIPKPNAMAWEMIAALESMTALAQGFGTEAERAKTEEAVGDLRIPVYQTGILWVRRTDATEELVRAWQEDIDAGADEQHAFLRALYSRRVLLCTLPPNWIAQWAWG
ncbi:MAG: hypothetical protein R6V11_05595 [Ectothiorhodospiraceae bacterium]